MRAALFAVLASVVGVSVAGVPSARADEAAPDHELTWSGSLAGRGSMTTPSDHALLSTADQPILGGLFEANAQARGWWFDRKLTLLVDSSLFLIGGMGYADHDDDGVITSMPEHDVAAHRPRLVLSDVSLRFEPLQHLTLTIGKQRVVWGPGMANNPTDVLNAPRDPTDPTFQRTGTWQARVDVPLENVTFSAMFAPAVLTQQNGVPVALLQFPDYDLEGGPPRDDNLHWAAAARAYALVADTDLNLWAVWKNRYGDDVDQRMQVMASASRLLNDELEGHAEVMLQQGSTRFSVDHDCVDDDRALARCALSGRSPFVRDLVADERLWPRILVGGRWMPADESFLTIEYLYASDGLLPDEFEDLVYLQRRAGQAQRAGHPVLLSQGGNGADGLPSRFTFDVVRRHYLFATYSRPHTLDEDVTVGASLVTALEDLSSVASASLTWSAEEWLQLSAFAFVPLPSVSRASAWASGDDDDAYAAFVDGVDDDSALRAFVPVAAQVDDEHYGALDGLPFSLRGVLEVRAFF
jgi:hypothetical protein